MGLLRGMARTAVIAGTATAASNRVSRRQARRWAAEEPQPTATTQAQYTQQPPPPSSSSLPPQYPAYESYGGGSSSNDAQIAQLERLGQLRVQGILTDEEFELKKRQVLGM